MSDSAKSEKVRVEIPAEYMDELNSMLGTFVATHEGVSVSYGDIAEPRLDVDRYKPEFVRWIYSHEVRQYIPLLTESILLQGHTARDTRVGRAILRALDSAPYNRNLSEKVRPFVEMEKERVIGVRADRLHILAEKLGSQSLKLRGVVPEKGKAFLSHVYATILVDNK